MLVRLDEAVKRWTRDVESGRMDVPVDGLVICYDDTAYAAGGSITGTSCYESRLCFQVAG